MKRKNSETEWFVRQVAEGDSALDADAVKHIATQLGIFEDACPCFCLAIQYKDSSLALRDVNMPVSLYNACMEVSKKQKQKMYCYTGAHLCVVMVVFANENERADIAKNLYCGIAKRISVPIRMGVGKNIADIGKLSYSKTEAYEALNSIESESSISYIDDIYVRRSSTTRKLEIEKRKVIELFKDGLLDTMMKYMVVLAEDIRMESPAREGMPYPTSIRRTILEILFEIMHIGADAGVDVEAVLNYQDPYNRVFEIDDTPEILSWFQGVAEALYRSISELDSRAEKNMLTLAKQYIEDHIADPELSLSLVSEYLGITPSYFSAFFIREMGVGFQEHITGLRITQAKELLNKTNQKINAIASECGFRSASYFINVFRKQTGVSPGEYRNMK